MYVWSKLSSEKWADAWEERFTGETHTVITRLAGKPTVRVEVYCETQPEALRIQKEFGGSIKELKSQNWASLPAQETPPVKVRDTLLIVTESQPAALRAHAQAYPGRHIISIPAEMAFGTGHHATTATVLRMLSDFAATRSGKNWSMLDLGTGSGVLAIAAAKMGSKDIWACDFDTTAVKVAIDNVRQNETPDVVVEEADVLQWKPKRRWDCVAANLFSSILEQVFPKLARSVAKDGVVLISGMLKTQADACLEKGREAGLVFDRIVPKGKWVSAQGRLA